MVTFKVDMLTSMIQYINQIGPATEELLVYCSLSMS